MTLETASQLVIVISFSVGVIIFVWRKIQSWITQRKIHKFLKKQKKKTKDIIHGKTTSKRRAIEFILIETAGKRRLCNEQIMAGMPQHQKLLQEMQFYIDELRHRDICECLLKGDENELVIMSGE